ncbi:MULTISPECIES: hypothetical protein [unclassified Rhizobium]|uniref:hypothetical protein n=1 Tax=unclassified Rhizobium TaxID=2613769 RepID=UPI001ADA3D8B|nr:MULTISPECIES: hypothetical protein [unclassified Rhizobium]MBO9100329.1 hypothetical protein [Rhizobium sp. L58/93]MBO9186222.1 hypothetical protein [Rhizobium sp. E27B/91]QXZ83141.1 hypothetical protein J5287_13810 [Rhizobium sp. K1/93]QXZ89347.1 hypothetical protein J5280_14780 [Rhizobium sp. K15/93]QYA01935.1 hypothetical protein J5278_01720 [Rhizobium sp. B21/90]
MPIWVAALQALLTPAIAVAVGVIAFMQWRTAHQKVVLEMFERRLAVYELVKSAVRSVNTSGTVADEAQFNLLTAINRAEFLFGNDVREYLEKLWEDYVHLQSATYEMADLQPGPERLAAIKRRTEHFRGITAFYKDSVPIFARYLRMDQKLIRTPSQWFSDRNNIRLSYADEKQS